jgi:large subunit ribosomal protein L22
MVETKTKEKKVEKKKVETKPEKVEKKEKKEEKKTEKPKVVPKPKEKPLEAKARAEYVPVSTKQAVNVCRFVKGKNVDKAIIYLEDVIKLKKAIPFVRHKTHTSHRKGMEAGRFPKKVSKVVIELLKSAKANANYLGLDEDKLIVTRAVPNRAFSKSSRRGRTTHFEIKVAEREEK